MPRKKRHGPSESRSKMPLFASKVSIIHLKDIMAGVLERTVALKMCKSASTLLARALHACGFLKGGNKISHEVLRRAEGERRH